MWWQEGRPEEGGRVTVVHCDATGNQRALLPSPWNARTRVHEYGGRSYLPVPLPGPDGQDPDGQAVVFANYADQRLYLMPVPPPGACGPGGRGRRAARSRRARSPRSRPQSPGTPRCVLPISFFPPMKKRCGASRNGTRTAR